jgi:hypothetical protein
MLIDRDSSNSGEGRADDSGQAVAWCSFDEQPDSLLVQRGRRVVPSHRPCDAVGDIDGSLLGAAQDPARAGA